MKLYRFIMKTKVFAVVMLSKFENIFIFFLMISFYVYSSYFAAFCQIFEARKYIFGTNFEQLPTFRYIYQS